MSSLANETIALLERFEILSHHIGLVLALGDSEDTEKFAVKLVRKIIQFYRRLDVLASQLLIGRCVDKLGLGDTYEVAASRKMVFNAADDKSVFRRIRVRHRHDILDPCFILIFGVMNRFEIETGVLALVSNEVVQVTPGFGLDTSGDQILSKVPDAQNV